MASDDTDERRVGDDGPADDTEESMRDAAVEEVDGRIVDLLSWILDTETRAKIYVYLLANPGSTSEEVARGTGLYPSTVREALAELHEEERVTREKRESEGAGNNPYEYTAIQPSELVGGVVDQVQHELNTIFTLDRVLDRDDGAVEEDVEPVTITVDEADDGDRAAGGAGGEDGSETDRDADDVHGGDDFHGEDDGGHGADDPGEVDEDVDPGPDPSEGDESGPDDVPFDDSDFGSDDGDR